MIFKLIDVIENKILELANDFDNGSTVIATKALTVFTEFLETTSKNNDLLIKTIIQKIIRSKPTMSALKNIIDMSYELFIDGIEPSDIKKIILKKMELSSNNSIDEAVKFIIKSNLKNIATCSYSTAVVNFLSILNKKKYKFDVLAVESFWNGKDYSAKVINKCNDLNLNARAIELSEISKVNIDCSLIGADAIVSNIGVVNGFPSGELSDLMKEIRKPLYIIAESFKRTNEIHIADGFDFIPKERITKIFSDNIFSI